MKPEIVLSLFDLSGTWCEPFRKDHHVIQVDVQRGRDVFENAWMKLDNVVGILAQPPCTDFANSGARWFAAKDEDGRTAQSIALVERTLELIKHHEPRWWALENPAGRIHKLVPSLATPRFKFSPHEYGEPWSKQTWLWGEFQEPDKGPYVDPEGMRPGQPPAWYSEVGGASLVTKNHRSKTSAAFARAFALAQSDSDNTST